jgi:hypothetical protein
MTPEGMTAAEPMTKLPELLENVTPAQQKAYQTYLNQVNAISNDPAYQQYQRIKSSIKPLEEQYYAADVATRRVILTQNPQLKAAWDQIDALKKADPKLAAYLAWSSAFWKANPDLSALLYGTEGKTGAATTLTKAATLTTPTGGTKTQQDLLAGLSDRDRQAYAEWARWYNFVKDVESGYFDYAQGSADRKLYLTQHPELKTYWDFRTDWIRKYPDLARKIFSAETVNSALTQQPQAVTTTARATTTTTAPITTSARGAQASTAQMNYLNVLGYRGNQNLSSALASALIDQYLSADRQTTQRYYSSAPKTTTPAPVNTWNALKPTIADPGLMMALQEYLYQSKAGRASVLKKYPKLKAWLDSWFASGKTDNDLAVLTSDYLLSRRTGKSKTYY